MSELSTVDFAGDFTKEDLPSAYDIKAFLHRKFDKHVKGLAAEIQVS